MVTQALSVISVMFVVVIRGCHRSVSSEGRGGKRACITHGSVTSFYLTRKADPLEAPSNSFCLWIFGPTGSHDHAYLEDGWAVGLVDQVCPWLTALPRALHAADASAEDAFPEGHVQLHGLPTPCRRAQWKESCLEAPTPHLGCRCPAPSTGAQVGQLGLPSPAFPVCLWAPLTQPWAGLLCCLWGLPLSREEGCTRVYNTQNFPKPAELACVLSEEASVLSAYVM